MTWYPLDESGTTPYDVCISLGIYFSTLNEGAFHKNVIMFNNHSRVLQLSGDFTDMYQQATGGWYGGGTNFQSVIDEIIRIRKVDRSIPLEDYPQTLIVVSDMQFSESSNTESNYQTTMRKLSEHFPKEWCDNFKMIWWYCRNGVTTDFPSNMDCGGTYMVSGYDGSIISFILGEEVPVDSVTGEKKTLTMEEVVTTALSQESLRLLTL